MSTVWAETMGVAYRNASLARRSDGRSGPAFLPFATWSSTDRPHPRSATASGSNNGVRMRWSTPHGEHDAPLNDQDLPVQSLDEKCESNEEVLRRLYQLTRAEARLAVALASGQSVHQAADRLCVCVATVRTHLQRIFSKTNTHHQAELVACLLAGPARLSVEFALFPEADA